MTEEDKSQELIPPRPNTFYDSAGYLRDKTTGQFTKGTKAGPSVEMRKAGGKAPSNLKLSHAIKEAFEMRIETVENLDHNNRIRRKRKRVMADALAQLISTGEVQLPNYYDKNHKYHEGKHFEFTADEWLSNLIKLLRYIEPPVQEIGLPEGTKAIIFDLHVRNQQGEQFLPVITENEDVVEGDYAEQNETYEDDEIIDD